MSPIPPPSHTFFVAMLYLGVTLACTFTNNSSVPPLSLTILPSIFNLLGPNIAIL